MSLTYNDTVTTICEFLEVAVHSILCLRGVYPAQVFVKRKKWDAPVYQSRSPALNEYISAAVKAIGQELHKGAVNSVVLVIKDRSDVALERFVFSVKMAVELDLGRDADTPIPDAATKVELHQHLRAFLIKLGVAEGQLSDFPVEDDELSFSLVMEMTDEATVPTTAPTGMDPVPWVPAVVQHTSTGASEDAELYVVRAIETGIIDFSLVMQESQEKRLRTRSSKSKGKGKEVIR